LRFWLAGYSNKIVLAELPLFHHLCLQLIAGFYFPESQQARVLKISFNFLEEGKNYTASIYCDDDGVSTRTKIKLEEKKSPGPPSWK